MVFPAAQGN